MHIYTHIYKYIYNNICIHIYFSEAYKYLHYIYIFSVKTTTNLHKKKHQEIQILYMLNLSPGDKVSLATPRVMMWNIQRLSSSNHMMNKHCGCYGLKPKLDFFWKNFPTYPERNIPKKTLNQQFMKEFRLHFGGLGIHGVCSKGMLGFS